MVDEMLDGTVYGVFIDDTGSEGMTDPPPNIRPGRKSWVAVIVPPDRLPWVLEELSTYVRALRGLLRDPNAEFHFRNIYAGEPPFAELPMKSRWDCFRLFVGLFEKYQLRILVRTVDSQLLAEMSPLPPTRKGGFDPRLPGDAALAAILGTVDNYIAEIRPAPTIRARVFVDEGWHKARVGLWLKVLERTFVDGCSWFADSRTMIPLQLADFAAFCFNRTQLLMGRETRSKRDVEFMGMIGPLAALFHNLELRHASGTAMRGIGSIV